MKQKSLPAVFMRGGTSKALMLNIADLPAERDDWTPLFSAAMGTPDPYGRQLDGMGGGVSSLSKVCIIGPSSHPDADVDYTFAQVAIKEEKVDYRGNCGNMSSAVGPYAVEQGMVKVEDGEACVRILNTNTNKIIHAHFTVEDGQPRYDGDLSIPGVGGTGSPIRLDFVEPGGASTGSLLPSGELTEWLDVPGVGRIDGPVRVQSRDGDRHQPATTEIAGDADVQAGRGEGRRTDPAVRPSHRRHRRLGRGGAPPGRPPGAAGRSSAWRRNWPHRA